MRILLTSLNGEPIRGQLEMEFLLPEGSRAIIGRSRNCEIPIACPLISRRHCELTMKNGSVYVRDLESTNGTGVNWRQVVEPTPIVDGDELWLANFGVRISIGDTDETANVEEYVAEEYVCEEYVSAELIEDMEDDTSKAPSKIGSGINLLVKAALRPFGLLHHPHNYANHHHAP